MEIMTDRQLHVITVDYIAIALKSDPRANKRGLQDAAPKPWIVDVAQQYRPKRTRGHRRVK